MRSHLFSWRACFPSVKQLLAMLVVVQLLGGTPVRAQSGTDNSGNTATPIKHVIIIVGENRTFDHIFATYKPVSGDKVDNLLSRHIVKEDGTPGPNFSESLQFSAEDTDKFQESPQSKSVYTTLPPPLVGGPLDVCKENKVCTLGDAMASENGLAPE